MLTIDGLITGIDTESIINGLLEIQQTQLDRLALRKNDLQTQRAAYDSLEAQLLSVQAAANTLARTANSVFTSRTVTLSNESALVVTAQNSAALGSYQLHIDALAHAHQVASNGFSDPDAQIAEGTFSIKVGTGAENLITIDSSNNTLQGLVDAINLSDADVSASIINDGTTGAPFRILLSANDTGAANQIAVVNNLTSGTGTQPIFDFLNPVQAATDAQIRLGDGPGALTVFSAQNRVDGVLDGVTLNLLEADPTHALTIRVGRNSEPAETALTDLVDSFNGLMDFIDGLVRFNPETEEAGILIGDRTVTDIQNEVRTLLQDIVQGVDTNANRLSVLGISVSDKGRLVVNSSRLQTVLQGDDPEISSDDLQRLFSLIRDSSNPNVRVLSSSQRTQASESPYVVDILQAAERAVITGGLAVPGSTILTTLNNSLNVTVDGLALNLSLTTGTYTSSELATLLEDSINNHPDINGRRVSIGINGSGLLELESESFGSTSEVALTSGTALASLGFLTSASDTGVDVAGSFIVDGQTESATGRGRVLTGNSDNANTADLQLLVSLSPSQIVAGSEAEITFAKGLATRLSDLISRIISVDRGKLDSARDRFDQRIATLDTSIERQQAIFDKQQEDLVRQFSALESAISELQTTSSFLATQLAGVSQLGSSIG